MTKTSPNDSAHDHMRRSDVVAAPWNGRLNLKSLPSHRSGLFALVLIGYCFVTVIFFAKWLPHIHSALIGPPEDNLQDFWNTWYAVVGRSHPFFFTRLIRYPEGIPLYYHSFAYPQIAVVGLLSKFFGTDLRQLIFLQNVTLLLSFPIAALGAFYFVRHFTKDVLGASAGGFIFAFNPWHTEQVMHHAHVSTIEFIPMFVVAYLLAIEKKSARWSVIAIALYALSALSCWYYIFYLAYFMVFHFIFSIYSAIRNRTLPQGWDVWAPVFCFFGTVLVMAPLLVPMVEEAVSGASVYMNGADANAYAADLAAYIFFPPIHLLGGLTRSIYGKLVGNEWECTVYLGLVNIAALVWLLRRGSPANGYTAYVLAGMATFMMFASGNVLQIFGRSLFPMPDAWLSHLPFFANVRTPARAIVLVYLFLSLGVGLASKLAMERYKGGIPRLAVLCAGGVMVLDFLPTHLPFTPVECPPGWAEIRRDPSSDFGVLMLPRAPTARALVEITSYLLENRYMLDQAACHGRPIVQGLVSRVVAPTLLDRLETNNFAAQRQQLINAKVKYVVVDRTAAWDPRDGTVKQYQAEYPITFDDAQLTILRVY